MVTLNSSTSGSFANKNVGTGKTVNVSGITLSGSDAGNYIVTNTTATTTADITPATLSVTGTVAQNKVYDATTAAIISGGTLSGVLGSDVVTLNSSTSGSFADKNVGTGKAVTAAITISGADSGNYTLSPVGLAANITAAGLTITAVANTKSYDRTTSAAAAPTITAGSLAGGDTVTLTEVYDSKLTGTGKTLTPAAVISDGNGGNNYLVTYVNNTTGVINPGQTVSGSLNVATGGKSVGFVVNGTLLPDQASTDASGNYTCMFPLNTIPNNSALLAYVVNDSSVKSASVYLAGGGNIANLLLSSNTVTASSGGGTMSNTTLGVAKGSLSSSDIPYSVSGTNLTLSPNFNFQTTSGTTYSINGNITTTNGAHTYNGPVMLPGNAVLRSGMGNISFGGPVTGTGYNFTLNSQGTVTQTAPITVAGLELLGTGGIYNLTNADNAVTTLAGNTGTINFTNSKGLSIDTVNATAGLTTSGDITLNNVGAVTTGSSAISSGGVVTITAHSPLTIGSGGVSAGGNIALEAAASGGADDLTINGPVSSTNGNLLLKAGSNVVLGAGGHLSAPHGTITLSNQLNGPPPADTGNADATSSTAVAFQSSTGTIAMVETKSDQSDDEKERKKKEEGGEQTTDEKKMDDKGKKYCN